MMGYVIAAFSALSLLLGGSTVYYLFKYENEVDLRKQSEHIARQQEDFVKLVKHESSLNLKENNKKYENDIDYLNIVVNKLRKSSASNLSYLSTDTSLPTEVTFKRESFYRAIGWYQSRIEGLIREGSECQIKLNNAIEWASTQKEIYDNKRRD